MKRRERGKEIGRWLEGEERREDVRGFRSLIGRCMIVNVRLVIRRVVCFGLSIGSSGHLLKKWQMSSR